VKKEFALTEEQDMEVDNLGEDGGVSGYLSAIPDGERKKKTIPKSQESFKVISQSGFLLLLINQMFENQVSDFFMDLIPKMISAITVMPTREQQICNKTKFKEFLEVLVRQNLSTHKLTLFRNKL
jgi:hypothetical protein